MYILYFRSDTNPFKIIGIYDTYQLAKNAWIDYDWKYSGLVGQIAKINANTPATPFAIYGMDKI